MIGLEVLVNANVGRRTQPTNVPRGTDLGVIARGDDRSKIITRCAGQPVGGYQSLSRRLRVTHRNSK